MRYIIHVIDDASQHIQKDHGFAITKGITEEKTICDILRSDSFYIIEAETVLDAIAFLTNSIKLKTSSGEEISLTEGFNITKQKMSTEDFSSNGTSSIKDNDLKIITASNSESYMASCQVEMEEDDEKWIELHNVYFYVIEENKLIEL